jgi:hypothetical protein
MSDRLLVSTKKGLFILGRNGNWSIDRFHFLGQNVTLTQIDRRDGALYAALNLGHFGVKLHRSSDGGQNWEELAPPAYPEGEQFSTGDGKPQQPATLKLIWALEPGAPSQRGRLWAGTAPGGLFRSDDHGKSWELVHGLWDRAERSGWFGGGYDYAAIHSLCIDPRDPNVIRLAISCGGVWMTRDGGATWQLAAKGMRAEYMPPELQFNENIQDPHHMVQSPSDPNVLWVQHHNGIFKTTNGAETWEEIKDVKPSVFGFGVAAHPRDPSTAWFVPAIKDEIRIPVDGKLVVNRTRDGGRSFEPLTRGLPQEQSYDLIYRHGLDVDETGNRLAIGSTTGGLWLSEDQGDSWQTLSAHLPPIHAVRFA